MSSPLMTYMARHRYLEHDTHGVQGDKKAKQKKDPRNFNDADLYKLEEEWTEEGDIDEGDLPEHLRKAEPIDFSKIDTNNPEGVIKMTKKHKTLMMFATVSGDPTEKETDELTALWQSSLYNANIEITRFVISSNRILIKLADGSYAYEIKDFLVEQDRCESVTIEGQTYHGKAIYGFAGYLITLAIIHNRSPEYKKGEKTNAATMNTKTGSKKKTKKTGNKKGGKKNDEL